MVYRSHMGSMIEIGTKVSGKYLGHAFSGTVYDRRPHSMNSEVIYFVELSQSLTVFGEPRTAITVTTGEPETHIEESR